MSLMFNGLGVSRGVAIGRAYRLQRDEVEIFHHGLTSAEVPGEIKRFKHAIEVAKQQIHDISNSIPLNLDVETSAFIETHLLMLDDDILAEGTVRLIREHQCNAEWALKLQLETIGQVFDAMEDDYLAMRKNDIQHVVQRIMRVLQNVAPPSQEQNLQSWAGAIVLTDDLTPADTLLMQHHGVLGFATESGGPLSHTAILARSLNIPAVVGLHGATRYIRDGETVIVDGNIGMLLADPTDDSVKHFTRKKSAYQRKRRELNKLKNVPATTHCGTAVSLQANIETEEDIKLLRRVNAAGVGLYRTEFLYMNRNDLPTEQEHYQNYVRIVRALKGAPLTIRVVDLGADKAIEYDQAGLPAHNPALGLRGVRRCLNDHAVFIPQLRAILRASTEGKINILFPMLTTIGEVLQLRELFEETRQKLRREGHVFEQSIALGGMIEVPSSAIMASQFAQQLDFLSIGTNDLIQYVLAMDRLDDQVNYLYDPMHPAVLKLIESTIKAGQSANIPVTMCGEMAGDSRYTRLLLSLGLRSFSMPANSLLEVKNVVTRTQLSGTVGKARKIINCVNTAAQRRLLDKLNEGLDFGDT